MQSLKKNEQVSKKGKIDSFFSRQAFSEHSLTGVRLGSTFKDWNLPVLRKYHRIYTRIIGLGKQDIQIDKYKGG